MTNIISYLRVINQSGFVHQIRKAMMTCYYSKTFSVINALLCCKILEMASITYYRNRKDKCRGQFSTVCLPVEHCPSLNPAKIHQASLHKSPVSELMDFLPLANTNKISKISQLIPKIRSLNCRMNQRVSIKPWNRI